MGPDIDLWGTRNLWWPPGYRGEPSRGHDRVVWLWQVCKYIFYIKFCIMNLLTRLKQNIDESWFSYLLVK